MKSRNWLIVVLAVCVLSAPMVVTGQTAITLGGNFWNASRDMSGDYYEGLESESSSMFGPYLNLRMGNIIIGGSMFLGTFTESSEDNDVYEVDMKRKDINLSIGLSLSRNVNVFFAMKKLTGEGTTDVEIPYYHFYYGWYYIYYWVDMLEGEVEYKEDGTLYGGGLSGVIPFSQSSFFIYWSGAYLSGTRTFTTTYSIQGVDDPEPTEFDPKTTLFAYSVGVGYQISPTLSLLVGYRSDSISSEWEPEGWDETVDAKDKYSGISATLAYTIRTVK